MSLREPSLRKPHRWGSGPMIKLLRENLDAFTTSINLGSLPKTFKDAIEIANRMGVRYLWIDSLCVIQDDEDCRRESAEDKLVALSGIARAVQDMLGYTYLAGLWKEHLPHELLWGVSG